jgi:hypothetical protein
MARATLLVSRDALDVNCINIYIYKKTLYGLTIRF